MRIVIVAFAALAAVSAADAQTAPGPIRMNGQAAHVDYPRATTTDASGRATAMMQAQIDQLVSENARLRAAMTELAQKTQSLAFAFVNHEHGLPNTEFVTSKPGCRGKAPNFTQDCTHPQYVLPKDW